MPILHERRVALIATDGFEALELIEPLRALRSEGARVDIIAPHPGSLQGMHQHHKSIRIHVDRVLGDSVGETVLADQYDSLVLPGGAISSDALRAHPSVRRFLTSMNDTEKPIATIGHAVWILISCGLLTGRKITGYPSLKEDVINSGAVWIDAPIVVDGNLISTRGLKEMATFDTAIVEHFARIPALISPESRHIVSRARFA